MILCFSGCGNSAHVARRLAELTGDADLLMLRGDLLRTAHIDAPSRTERIVWVFPVYSWGVPPVVVSFIKRLECRCAERAAHHLVLTCGDDCGLTSEQWRSLLHRRGWRTLTASSIIMPNTYVLMKGFDVDSPELTRQKLEAATERVAVVADLIAAGMPAEDVKTGRWAWVKSRIIYPWFVHNAMDGRRWRVTDRCISCGRCERACPTSAVKLDAEGVPRWSEGCAMCCGCYNICPVHAIEYKKATLKKGQWYYVICKK